ncbi:hypothetical protein NU219Hw_g8027t1 [Hortaea werneckii]
MEPLTPSDTSTTAAAAKRKREDSASTPSAPAAKASKTGNQLSINYLARHTHDDLPLLTKEDTLPNLVQLLSAYSNVLDRHESLASNLGARPLGPILIKRFERCFDAPPKIVASHHKGSVTNADDSGHAITWLEVIEFARSHPGQFNLSTFSEGKRVCQFYYPQKQLRVQISEEDFIFINSGRCQELIPPLPIWEDEEKEVGTCDVLETKLKELTNVADMVAARTRQLSHRLKGRRSAILERRAEGGSGTPAKASAVQTTTAPASGFSSGNAPHVKPSADSDLATVRSELLRHFEALPQNQASAAPPHSRHPSTVTYDPQSSKHENDRADGFDSSLSPAPAHIAADKESTPGNHNAPGRAGNGTGSAQRPSVSMGAHSYNAGHGTSKHNFSRPLPPALESTQPFRPLCQAHMDSLPRGTRVMPPCDRCRRLRMDCVKNLTSCAGCTKKHARCHWRDVSRDELGELDQLMEAPSPNNTSYERSVNGYMDGSNERAGSEMMHNHHDDYEESEDEDSNPLEDLEALGEKEEQRERELAEQMRVDEEGLEQARELSRQGREAVEKATSNGTPAPTSELADAEPTPAANGVSDDRPAEATATQPAFVEPDKTLHQTSPPPTQAQPPSFVPMYGESVPAYGGGFHAVNKPTNSTEGSTGGWSTM